EGGEQFFGALGRERIDPELGVVGLASPGVLVLGTVADDEQDSRGRKALDQAVEQRLALGISPVEILEEQEERLDPTFPEEEPLWSTSQPWVRGDRVNSQMRRDFPTPASPTMATACPCPAPARSSDRRSTSISASRPTNRVSPRRAAACSRVRAGPMPDSS